MLCNRCIRSCKSDKTLCMSFKSVDDKGHKAEDSAMLQKAIQEALWKKTGVCLDENGALQFDYSRLKKED